jgi:hypothetical protein
MMRSAMPVAKETHGRGEASLLVRGVACAILSYLFVLPLPSRYFFAQIPCFAPRLQKLLPCQHAAICLHLKLAWRAERILDKCTKLRILDECIELRAHSWTTNDSLCVVNRLELLCRI